VTLPFLIILFDPQIQTQEMTAALEKLNASRHIAAFAKPVNLATLLHRMMPALEAKQTKGA
jgi:hypothetical protein